MTSRLRLPSAGVFALGVAALFAGASASAQIVTLCPNSPSRGAPVPSAAFEPPIDLMLATPLTPGATVATTGTNPTVEPHLAGTVLVTETRSFSFNTPGGLVTGTLKQRIVGADDGTCDLYWQVSVTPTSVGQVATLTITDYVYKASRRLVADFRNDLAGTVAPNQATRSGGIGSMIRFNLPAGVGPGETSRWMLLDTRINAAAKKGFVQLRGVGGGESPAFKAFVPSAPPP